MTTETLEYTEAERLAFLRAVANLIAADHKVTEDEKAELNGLVLQMGLSPLDPRVEGDVLGELDSPGDLPAILSAVGNAELKSHLFRVLVEVAAADGKITDGERTKIREAAGVFGLDADAASDLLDWTVASIQHEQKECEILARLGL